MPSERPTSPVARSHSGKLALAVGCRSYFLSLWAFPWDWCNVPKVEGTSPKTSNPQTMAEHAVPSMIWPQRSCTLTCACSPVHRSQEGSRLGKEWTPGTRLFGGHRGDGLPHQGYSLLLRKQVSETRNYPRNLIFVRIRSTLKTLSKK